jgi:type I restriction enzyme M protein
MRVSPVAWYAKSLEEAIDFAKASAEVTHSHPEGIKGAVVTAGAAYLARMGATMDEIKVFVAKYYKIDFTLNEIRPIYEFNETCQDTVPQAMQAFFESISFEDAIRNAISIGGDSDTLAAITGAVAEAYYGITERKVQDVSERLDPTLLKILSDFRNRFIK